MSSSCSSSILEMLRFSATSLLSYTFSCSSTLWISNSYYCFWCCLISNFLRQILQHVPFFPVLDFGYKTFSLHHLFSICLSTEIAFRGIKVYFSEACIAKWAGLFFEDAFIFLVLLESIYYTFIKIEHYIIWIPNIFFSFEVNN